jgi:His-Xaa-Ser system radical SAM maturase HxsC
MSDCLDDSLLYLPYGMGHICISAVDGQVIQKETIIPGLEPDRIYIDSNGSRRQSSLLEDGCLTIIPTLSCNERCIICPQCKESSGVGALSASIVSSIDYSRIHQVYITGGEPYIAAELLSEIVARIPNDIEISILTNGTLNLLESPFLLRDRLRFCIPLYASISDLHNRIVGYCGFYKTIKNLFHLGNNNIVVELRNVITKQNYTNLPLFAHYVCNNLPFVANVALMGLELIENAEKNSSALWVDPTDYNQYLLEAVNMLIDFKIPCSLFNMPLCTLPNELYNLHVASISPWKRRYLEKCKHCNIQNKCGGMFFSSASAYSHYINPH